MFCTFWLGSVLRATTACNFSTCRPPDVAQGPHFFSILTWKCASATAAWSGAAVFCTLWLANVLRATAAYNFSFFIWRPGSAPAALASLLFDPPDPQIIGKMQRFTTFLKFRAHVSSSSIFSLTSLSLFYSSLLCFSSLYTSSSRASRGRKFQKKKVVYSKERICL